MSVYADLDVSTIDELPPGRSPIVTKVLAVGGTGVITIGQLLGVAAHIEGKGVVTQDAAGLAQKGGATWSHVLIGARQEDILTTRVGTAAADLILGCDPIVTASAETLARMREGRTHVALNAQATPTASSTGTSSVPRNARSPAGASARAKRWRSVRHWRWWPLPSC